MMGIYVYKIRATTDHEGSIKKKLRTIKTIDCVACT